MFVGGDGAATPTFDSANYIMTLEPADETNWCNIPTLAQAVWLAGMHLLGTPVAATTVIAAMHDPMFRAQAVEYVKERIQLT